MCNRNQALSKTCEGNRCRLVSQNHMIGNASYVDDWILKRTYLNVKHRIIDTKIYINCTASHS